MFLFIFSLYAGKTFFKKNKCSSKVKVAKILFFEVYQPEIKTGNKMFTTITKVLKSSETARGKS